MGSIWPKRSSTPRVPKSGEHEVQTAPTLALASIAAIACGPFGSQPATRSPGRTPRSRSHAAHARHRARELVPAPRRPRARSSARKISAGSPPLRRSRFSAKLSRASGNQRVPGIARALRASSAGPGPSPRSSANDHTSSQNAAGSSIDQRCSAAGSREIAARALLGAAPECGPLRALDLLGRGLPEGSAHGA